HQQDQHNGQDHGGALAGATAKNSLSHFQYTSDFPVASAVSVIGNEPSPPEEADIRFQRQGHSDLIVELDASGGGPPDVRVKPGAVGKRRRTASGFRTDPAGNFRLTHQLHGIGVQLLFGDIDRQHTDHQRQHQHGAYHQDANIDIAFAGAPFQ